MRWLKVFQVVRMLGGSGSSWWRRCHCHLVSGLSAVRQYLRGSCLMRSTSIEDGLYFVTLLPGFCSWLFRLRLFRLHASGFRLQPITGTF